jgi:AcrR family transcriptional regulator
MQFETKKCDEVLAAAALLFRAKGYHATTMQDIADRTKIQKPSLYHHFASKEDLVIAVMEKVQTHFDRYVFSYAYDQALSPEDRLINMSKAVSKFFSKGNTGCVFINLAIETLDSIPAFLHPVQHYFLSCTKAYYAIFAEVYNKEDAITIADDFTSDLQGALIMTRVTGNTAPLQRLSERLLKTLRAGKNDQGSRHNSPAKQARQSASRA